MMDELISQPLAIAGGPKANPHSGSDEDIFRRPTITQEEEQAVLNVLRAGTMSSIDIAMQFEQEWGAYQDTTYNVSYPNGTMALQVAMYAAGVRRGDEIICPSLTYWASILQCFGLGATPVFADIDPSTLCIDPNDIEHRITDYTRAIVVVHYCGYPADMDVIMTVAEKHNLKVIEDVSHAHGSLYKGRKCGSIGHIAAMSMMSSKSFAIGEGGMLCTDNHDMYELAISYANYKRHGTLTDPQLKAAAGLPSGGMKGRINQIAAAIGRVQLKYYPERIIEIQSAINRFWDLLEGTPGLKPHRPSHDSGNTMGGWYNPIGLYQPDELNGLPVERFIEAVIAEGGQAGRGINCPLHLHPLMNEVDVYADGKPTRLAFASRDVRQAKGSLPVTEAASNRAFGIPYFKHDQPGLIERYAAAYRKVVLQADKLL